jgi:hypothetical protein
MLRPLVPTAPRDGGLLIRGEEFYVHSVMRTPDKKLVLVDYAGSLPCWIDGREIAIWKMLDKATGRILYCEAWQLTRMHRDILFGITSRIAIRENP